MSEVVVIFPPVSDSEVTEGLRSINRALRAAGLGDDGGGGLLGGADGYPVAYENDTFAIAPYCWCERVDCRYCAECFCTDDASRYFVNGIETTYEQWAAAPRDADRAITEVPKNQCGNCRLGPDRFAPQFTHKPSRSSVRFYKYIGRGMQVDLTVPWHVIHADVLASLTP